MGKKSKEGLNAIDWLIFLIMIFLIGLVVGKFSCEAGLGDIFQETDPDDLCEAHNNSNKDYEDLTAKEKSQYWWDLFGCTQGGENKKCSSLVTR